jgi:hypothetical protein
VARTLVNLGTRKNHPQNDAFFCSTQKLKNSICFVRTPQKTKKVARTLFNLGTRIHPRNDALHCACGLMESKLGHSRAAEAVFSSKIGSKVGSKVGTKQCRANSDPV